MQVHLITIEIGIVCITVGIMHTNSLFFGQDSCNMSHNTRFVQSWLSVYQKDIPIMHVAINYLSSHSELIGEASSLVNTQCLKMYTFTCFLIFNDIRARMNLRAVNHAFSQSLSICLAN